MFPALYMGILTNAYIAVVLISVGALGALFSPIVGTVIFLGSLFLLKANTINARFSFLVAAYTVAAEVCFHTYILGWSSGFYYFMLLLPVVFLLHSAWKPWMIIFFNASVGVITGLLGYTFIGRVGVYGVPDEILYYINLCNASGTAIVVIVVIIYFSRTIYKKEEALLEANRELGRQNKEISEQHRRLQILIKEIHHRVKNNLQIISSLMSLQGRTVEDGKVARVLNESRRRVEAIALIHQKLYQDDNVNRVDFRSYLEELMNSQQAVNSHVKCMAESNDVVLSLDIAVPLGLIVSEMITNSIKHAFEGIENPELLVRLKGSPDAYELTVQDNGVGLPNDFSLEEPCSLGSEIIMALTDQIGARVEYENKNGARFTVFFADEDVDD